MKTTFSICIILLTLLSCNDKLNDDINRVVAAGQMPDLSKDQSGMVHLVYGNGDSILYRYTSGKERSFSNASLVAILPHLAASHMRGPQVSSTSNGVVVTACNDLGNIFSFTRDRSGHWSQPVKVNDVDTVAKENLMALAADGNNAFAVWLDLRDGHNKIYGARSNDAGRSWSKNILIYASPDTTVCQCCKPNVAIQGNHVYVMFRNWLNGNRDLYLVQSADGGNTFTSAEKLGRGSWQLNGCPMDGGGVALTGKGNVKTVWNRKGVIYACEPGKEEVKLGEGKNCKMDIVNDKTVYTWIEDGDVVVMAGQKKTNLGKGKLPVLKAVDNEHVICVWEQDKEIHTALLDL
jgi:hypothetical protein